MRNAKFPFKSAVVMGLYSAWVRTVDFISNFIIPQGLSVMEIEIFFFFTHMLNQVITWSEQGRLDPREIVETKI